MSKDRHFHQYGYDHYLRASQNSQLHSFSSRSKRGILMRKFKGSVFGVGFLVVAAVFAGVVVATYPSAEDDAEKFIPIVQADLSPVRRAPAERGGMDIPNAESTVLARSEPAVLEDGVENLLARSVAEPLVMKDEAIELAMSVPAVSEVDDSSVVEVVSSSEIEEPSAENILQKIEASAGEETGAGFEQQVAQAAVAVKPKRQLMHAPGQSPDTLAFVRRVLSAEEAASIEPTAGAAKPSALAPGGYYVQLASIKDRARADSEWRKMRAKYGALGGAEYRVQQASLSSGTFYRIQAGPMSKASADEVCGSLKAANKPGGCLVVK